MTTLAAVSDSLTLEGFAVEQCADGEVALERAIEGSFELVVLDPNLRGLRGLQGCRLIRAASPVPIVIVSARDSPADRVLGLEAGADDYLGKPFAVAELISRVRAIRRRRQLDQQPLYPTLCVGDVEIDVVSHRVTVAGRLVTLTPLEFRLLTTLAREPGRPLGAAEILRRLWQTDHVGCDAACRTHIFNLRRKIDADSSASRIVTVRGVGYLLTRNDRVQESKRNGNRT